MKKGIVLPLLLLLASVSLILGAFFVLGNKQKTANQNSTQSASLSSTDKTVNTDEGNANWRRYTDPDIDFTFDYPNNFEAKSYKSTDPKNFEIEVRSPDDYRDRDAMRLRLIVAKNTQNLTLEKYLQDTNGDPSVKITTKKKEFVMTNIPLSNAFSYTGDFGGSQSKVYVFLYKDKFYTVALYGGTGAGAGYTPDSEKIFNQILSTFKFTQ